MNAFELTLPVGNYQQRKTHIWNPVVSIVSDSNDTAVGSIRAKIWECLPIVGRSLCDCPACKGCIYTDAKDLKLLQKMWLCVFSCCLWTSPRSALSVHFCSSHQLSTEFEVVLPRHQRSICTAASGKRYREKEMFLWLSLLGLQGGLMALS